MNARTWIVLTLSGLAVWPALAGTGTPASSPLRTKARKAPVHVHRRAYIFEATQLEPSHDGESYVGHFRFINKASRAVKIPGFDAPINGTFEPTYVHFEALHEGRWKEVPQEY